MMCSILKKIAYIVKDEEGKNNKIANNFDYALVHIYAIISMFNAITSIGTTKLFVTTSEIDKLQGFQAVWDEYLPVIKTILLLIVNAIILVRLNIKLYIKEQNIEKEAIMNVLFEKSVDVVKVVVIPLRRRMQLIKYVYVIDIVIILMNVYYKSSIETSLSLIVILPIFVTWVNNLIEIAENKFSAEPIVHYMMDKKVVSQLLEGKE